MSNSWSHKERDGIDSMPTSERSEFLVHANSRHNGRLVETRNFGDKSSTAFELRMSSILCRFTI